ncbi:hypothetical protein LG202_03340 [Methylobacillus methanolivorans]
MHFVVGKGGTAFAGVFAALLIVRELSIEEFAQYSILIALVELLTAVSGLGLAHALLRYVPELYQKNYQSSLKKFVYSVLSIRTFVLGIALSFAYLFTDNIIGNIGLSSALAAFQVFLLTVLFRSTVLFLSQILESTLHQGAAQLAFFIAAATRVAGLIYLSYQGDVDLYSVVWLEVVSDILSFIVVIVAVNYVVAKNPNETEVAAEDSSWIRTHLKKIMNFAVVGYIQHLAILPYGGHTNRLVGGHMLSSTSMAHYGFAQTIYEYIKRYLPAQLLVGLVRPVVVARYCEHKDFSVPAKLCELVLQINYLFIAGLFVLLIVAGKEGLSLLSAGKYGSDAFSIVVALFFVLVLETQRQQLELLVQTVEKYQYLIYSNSLLSTSVIGAILFLPLFGPIAFPMANAVGLLVANAWVRYQLKAEGFAQQRDWFPIITILIISLTSIFVGEALKAANVVWYISGLSSGVVFGVLGFVLCRGIIIDFMRDFIGGYDSTLPNIGRKVEVNEPCIAFGLLSSKKSTAAISEIAIKVYPHTLYVHHDFSKQPDFEPIGSNIVILSSPVSTAWGDWSLVAATLKLLEEALANPKVTHFQLLSESCLPVKSIKEFEQYLIDSKSDVMMDLMQIKDDEALFSHGWRYLTTSAIGTRISKRASMWVVGNSTEHLEVCSVNLKLAHQPRNLSEKITSQLGKSLLRAMLYLTQGTRRRQGINAIGLGGQWFGASRRVCSWIVEASHKNKKILDYFAKCQIPDEAYIHTLLLNINPSGNDLVLSPSNHALFWHGCSTGPDVVQSENVDQIKKSGKFFARKFSLKVDDPTRASFSVINK